MFKELKETPEIELKSNKRTLCKMRIQTSRESALKEPNKNSDNSDCEK